MSSPERLTTYTPNEKEFKATEITDQLKGYTHEVPLLDDNYLDTSESELTQDKNVDGVLSKNERSINADMTVRSVSRGLGRKSIAVALTTGVAMGANMFVGVGVNDRGEHESAARDAISKLLGPDTAQAKRGYAPERMPSVFNIYDMQKQQALGLRPDTIFDEPLDRDVNTKNRVSSCYSGQEIFKQALIDIKNDRRTVEVLLTTASQSRYNRLNEYGSWQKGSPEWHVPAQCDDVTKLDATIELDLQKYTKNPRMRTYPRKMLGRLARKRVPRHDVYVDPSQPMLNVQPKRYTFTDKIILKSQKKITDRQLKNKQVFVGFYTQRAQRGRIDPDWPSVTSEMKYLRPITTMKKTKRYYSVGDTWWVGHVPTRKDILKSVDKPPKPKKK